MNNQPIKKLVFFDLDETLIHSSTRYWLNGNPHAPLYDLKFSDGPDDYVFSLRPGALDLLAACRAQYDGVCMLTAATAPYAAKVNKIGGLGFHPQNEIFSRESMAAYYQPPGMMQSNKLLFDNLSREESEGKLRFLRNVTGTGKKPVPYFVTFVQADEYVPLYGRNRPLDVEAILQSFEKAFNRNT